MHALSCIVVDDSLIFRKVVRDCLKQVQGITVVDVAADGFKAIEKIVEHKPDLVTLDVEMPGCDGIDVLRQIRDRGINTDVIMVSSQTDRAASATTRALALGAFDYVLKPSAGSPEQNMRDLVTELSPRVEAIRRRRRRSSLLSQPPSPNDNIQTPGTSGTRLESTYNAADLQRRSNSFIAPTPKPRNTRANWDYNSGTVDLIAIGVSTGGPAALREILPKLPVNLSVPILIVQHMPPLFTASLARDLNDISQVTVCEAAHRQSIRPGTVYIAPGGKQMKVGGPPGARYIEITDDPPVRACRPSVDYLFESVAKIYGASALAIVLTGMGNDGTAGCRAIVDQGGHTIAQDETTSTVFGMPRQVIEAGLADRIESLQCIPAAIARVTSQGALACL